MNKLQAALMGTTLAVALAVSGGSAYAAKGMVTAPAPAAMSGLYVSVFGGIALPSTATGTYDSYAFTVPLSTGFLIGGAIGTHFTDNLRGEIELSLAQHGVGTPVGAWGSTYTTSTGSVSTLFALANLWFDINTGSQFTPYLGGGAGFAVTMPKVTWDTSYYFDRGSITPAAQFGAGVKMQVTDNMSVDVGYRAKAVFSHTWPSSYSASSAYYPARDMNWLEQSVQVGLTVGF